MKDLVKPLPTMLIAEVPGIFSAHYLMLKKSSDALLEVSNVPLEST
jgi:hypothetical protein